VQGLEREENFVVGGSLYVEMRARITVHIGPPARCASEGARSRCLIYLKDEYAGRARESGDDLLLLYGETLRCKSRDERAI